MADIPPGRLLQRSRRLHQRAGLVAIPVMVVVLLTGVMLGHSEELGLSEARMPNVLVRLLYGVPDAGRSSYPAGDRWITQIGDTLYLDAAPVESCEARALKGALVLDRQFVLLCEDALLVMDGEGALIERIGSEHGLPLELLAIGVAEGERGELFMRTEGGEVLALDLATLATVPASAEATVRWSMAGDLPGELQGALPESVLPAEFNLERLLLDLHSGRLFGRVGVFVVDAIALVVTLLLVSGFAMWYARR